MPFDNTLRALTSSGFRRGTKWTCASQCQHVELYHNGCVWWVQRHDAPQRLLHTRHGAVWCLSSSASCVLVCICRGDPVPCGMCWHAAGHLGLGSCCFRHATAITSMLPRRDRRTICPCVARVVFEPVCCCCLRFVCRGCCLIDLKHLTASDALLL